jgi:hypothetical protein
MDHTSGPTFKASYNTDGEEEVQSNKVERSENTSSTQGWWTQFAHFISRLTNPLFVALPTFLLIALRTAPDLLHALLWWVIVTAGISVAPLMFIARGVRRGHYSDKHLSVREQRIIPLIFGMGCAAVAFVALLLLHASAAFLATVVAVLVGGVITLVVTKYWTKISLHMVGIAGAVTALSLVFGPLALLLSPLVVIVAWARWQVRAHTLLQMLLGTALAVSITIGIFRLFGV